MRDKDFDSAVNRYGGLYDRTKQLPKFAQDRLSWSYERINTVSLFAQAHLGMSSPQNSLSWEMLNNDALGAMCLSARIEGIAHDFVGMNEGSVYVLFDTFARILAHPCTFPEVGNAAGECAERAYIGHLSKRRSIADYVFVEALDDVRAVYARGLALIALEFLTWHEIAHLRNGHADWKQSTLGLGFDEVLTFGVDGPAKIDLQVCEYDADCAAMQWTINRSFDKARQIAAEQWKPKTNGEYALYLINSSAQELAKATIYAVYTMFRLLDDTEFNWESQHKRSHPQPIVRQFIIQRLIFTLFQGNPAYEIDAHECASIIRETISRVEEDYAAVQQRDPDASRFQSLFIPKNFRRLTIHQSRLHKAWSRMHPMLNEFKRHGNLAKVNMPDKIVIPFHPDYDFGDR